MKLIKLFLGLTIVFSNNIKATVIADVVEAGPPLVMSINLSGEIIDEDAKRFEKILDGQRFYKEKFGVDPAYLIHLNSSGGDVDIAIKIGRITRKLNGLVSVGDKGCYSSCVLVLAGAGYRALDKNSKVGIHRPYLIKSENLDAVEIRSRYLAIQGRVETYLQEMNVSPNLYKDMLAISPEKIKVLNWSDLEMYGIATNDPYIDEAAQMKEARNLRITREELVRRKSVADQKCDYLRVRCWQKITDKTTSQYPEECTKYSKCKDLIVKYGE